MKKTLSALLLLALPSIAAAQGDVKPPVSITPIVDKTAIWVGDNLRYTVRAVYDRKVEMVLDHFTKERLTLLPFVIRDIDIRHKDWAEGKKAVEITFTLTTFETGKTELTLPLLPLYYFVRESGSLDKEKPLDSVPAPAQVIGLRSALVTETMVPRTQSPVPSRGLSVALVPLLLGFAGLAGVAGYSGRRWWLRLHPQEKTSGLSREARERIVQDSLDRLRGDVGAAGEDARRWSGAIAAALRGMVGQLFQMPASAHTPEELEAALARCGADLALASEVKAILSECDTLRYGPEAVEPQRLRTELTQAAERIMQSPHWVAA